MNLWTINELKAALKEIIITNTTDNNISIDHVFIDSRKSSKNGLFIALKGENTDGHNYVKAAFEMGASLAIVDRIPDNIVNTALAAKLIVVFNTYEALNQLALYARQRAKGKIIALTGSVGKTSTKEMLKIAFESQGKTFANTGNLNNHIGLPLSLANLNANCDYAILEMGMNHLNEIIHLTKIARPHLAIITNVGPVHIEFFKNEQEIAKAKSEIFGGLDKDGIALINADNKHFAFIQKQTLDYGVNPKNLKTFGHNNPADYKISDISIQSSSQALISATYHNQKTNFAVNITNKSVAFNAIIVLACLDLIGKNVAVGLESLQKFTNSAGRGKTTEIVVNHKKLTIIDDTYNASILSMKAGLENCLNLKTSLNKKRAVCAVGDMLELGDKSLEIHMELLDFIKKNSFDLVILVGNSLKLANDKVNLANVKIYQNSQEASHEFENFLNDGDIVYFKGSRGIKMEKLIENLIQKN